MQISRCLVVCLLSLVCLNAAAGEEEFAIRDGDTVVFLGDSITAERTCGKIIENYTLLRFPDRQVRFINAGVGGDTAADGLKRLEHDVFKHHPSVVTIAFGINDIGWGLNADDAHRQTHLDSIREIVKACVARDIRVYVCSAAITGNDPAQGEESYLQKMSDEAMQLAREHGGLAIDVQRGMREIQQVVWDANSDKTTEERRRLLHTDDTIHLNELGKLAMAYAMLKGLGAPADVSSVTIDAKAAHVTEATGCEITGLQRTDDGLTFTRLDAGLPFSYGLFFENHYQFVPVAETLNRYLLSVNHLPVGRYQLTASGRDVGTFTTEQLSEGVNISSATGNVWAPGGPWAAQGWILKSLTDARHQALTALHSSQAWLADTDVPNALSDEVAAVNERFERMQRSVSQPVPYDFVLTRVIEGAATVANGFVIESPREYQVFQRHRREEGRVVIRGTYAGEADRVQIRLRGSSIDDEVDDEWCDVTFTVDSGSIDDTLVLPAGGWYVMDVQALLADEPVGQATVQHFGRGEVFVGAGQSNSTNCGEFKTQLESGMVSSFSGEFWQIANDPQVGVADKTQGGSFWPAFGDAMHEALNVPIGVATTGFGGTSINAWQPETDLFKWTMTRIDQLGSHGFRALLWHQGESDFEMTSDEYYGKLKRTIDATREQAGWEIPWFVAQASYHNPDKPAFDDVRAAQKRLWTDRIAHQGPDTDTLKGDHRDSGGLGVHFSPKGLKAHGEMWADLIGVYVKQETQE